MPAVPPTTPWLGLPRFASDASSATWAHLNAISDTLDTIMGPWTAYTPSWTQSNGTVLHLGSGTIVGRYKVMGRTMHAHILLTRAADSNEGSTAWVFGLPPVQARSWNMVGGGFAMVRNGLPYGGAVFPVSTGFVGAQVGAGRVSNLTPAATHAAGDWYSLQMTMERA